MGKFRALIVLTIGILPLLGYGQKPLFSPEMAVGLRGGAVMSSVSFYPAVNQNLRLGMQGGAVFRYISERYLGVQVELNYVQRGWQEDYAEFNYNRRLDYLEVPFLSHFYFGKRSFKWFFNLGPTVSYQLGERVLSDVSSENERPEHTLAVKNRFDYAIALGTGFDIRTRVVNYQLEARYNFGLGDMFPSNSGAEFRRSSNQVISVALGILFNVNNARY